MRIELEIPKSSARWIVCAGGCLENGGQRGAPIAKSGAAIIAGACHFDGAERRGEPMTKAQLLAVGSTAGLGALVEARCPFTIPPQTERGCCTWQTFLESFADSWPRFFKVPPDRQQWLMARRDWRAGNTGYEAAHNAMRRLKERESKGVQYGAQSREIAAAAIKRAAKLATPNAQGQRAAEPSAAPQSSAATED